MINIAVLYNVPSKRFVDDPTHLAAEDDTVESAQEVHEALLSKGAQSALVPISEDTIALTVAGLSSYDLVFNLIEWTGVDTTYAMQTYDEFAKYDIHITGATKECYRVTCDKIPMKKLLDKAGLPTAPWQYFDTGNEPISDHIMYPSLVKVASEHSSVGLSKEAIVHSERALRTLVRKRIREFTQPVIVEAFLTGREFQVTLLERRGGLFVLPPAEIMYKKDTDAPLLTYDSRWDVDHPDYGNSTVGVARLDDTLAQTIDVLCRKAFGALSFRDYARFDLRCDEKERPYFLEVNSNPGLGDDEEYGMTLSYTAAGLTFADFVWEIVKAALRRYGRH